MERGEGKHTTKEQQQAKDKTLDRLVGSATAHETYIIKRIIDLYWRVKLRWLPHSVLVHGPEVEDHFLKFGKSISR